MDSLELLHAKIHGFPGYDTALERRHSDEYVRSYLGERLSEMAVRCTLPPDLQARVDVLLLRVAFANPKDFNAHDVDGTPAGDDGALAATDAGSGADVVDLPAVVHPTGVEPPPQDRAVEGARPGRVTHLERHVGDVALACPMRRQPSSGNA